MATKTEKVNIAELRTTDRIFHIDHDTYVIYTGLHRGDIRPFTRIGVGGEIPAWLPRYVENVILPQEASYNAGLEIAWVRATLQAGQKDVRYVGSRERVMLLYNFAGMPEIAEQQKWPPLQAAPYGPPRSHRGSHTGSHTLARDRANCSFFANGNIIIEIGSARVFDYLNAQRSKITIDREYDLLSKALAKLPYQPCRQAKQCSFIWLGGEKADAQQNGGAQRGQQRANVSSHSSGRQNFASSFFLRGLRATTALQNPVKSQNWQKLSGNGKLSIYWNLMGRGLLLNPPLNYRYALFENYIDPKRVDMLISHNPLMPGFTEALRRKDFEGSEVGVYTGQSSRLALLNRLYRNLTLKPFSNDSSLPMVRDVGFFPSRNGSHAVFGWRFAPKEDKITQLLFPLAAARPRKGFEFLRPPHDLELQLINSRADFKKAVAHVALQFPGQIHLPSFLRRRISHNAYPLVPGREYIIHQSLKIEELTERFLLHLQEQPYADQLRSFAYLNLGMDFSSERLGESLKALMRLPVPRHDLLLWHNIGQFLRFNLLLPMYEKGYGRRERKLLWRLFRRFSLRGFSYREWLEMGQGALDYHLLFAAGQASFLLLKAKDEQPPSIKVPSSFEQLEANPKSYGRLLRSWERQVNRLRQPNLYGPLLDILEKLYEAKVALLQERLRLRSLLRGLNLELKSPAVLKSANAFVEWRRGLTNFLGKISQRVESSLESLPGFSALFSGGLRYVAALLLVILLLIGGIGAISAISGIIGGNNVTEQGDSAAEISAVQLVAPGDLQGEEDVPGADAVPLTAREILQYANALAEQNNFRRLNASNQIAELRDPNLVFPGDLLRLPDSRLARVERGDHLWNIAREHYRRDYARLQILDRQLETVLGDLSDNSLDVDTRREIKVKQAAMTRLAITADMRRLLARANKRIASHLKGEEL